jgi:pimeloyl-ACP methyl ester carboxylesterase
MWDPQWSFAGRLSLVRCDLPGSGRTPIIGSLPDARRATIAGAAHGPNLEQPDAFDALVLPFLGYEA